MDFDKWSEYLSDGPLAMAFLDRLVEGAIILKIKGKSYRAPKTKSTDETAGEKSIFCRPRSLGLQMAIGQPLHWPLLPAKMDLFFSAINSRGTGE